jgi:hypothetical protein
MGLAEQAAFFARLLADPVPALDDWAGELWHATALQIALTPA